MKVLITAVIIVGIAAVGGSIIVGMISFDGTVTDHPYEKGLAWDDTQKKKDELGWKVEIHNREFITGDNEVFISVLDKNNKPLAVTEVTLYISRPATTTFSNYFDIMQVKDGMFSAHLKFPLFGYWDIGINVSSGGDTLLYKKRVFVKKEGR